VWASVVFSRGIFGRRPDAAHIEKVLRQLSLWDKKDNTILTLSGGMKRRLLIAKALSHEPRILFLDEPTAGVDVELRRDMWQLVRGLRDTGVNVIATTHYIEEAEEMADRVVVIHKGRLVLIDDKAELMRKMGGKQLTLQLQQPVQRLLGQMGAYPLSLSADGTELTYTYDARSGCVGVVDLLKSLGAVGVQIRDLHHRVHARGHLRAPGQRREPQPMNLHAVRAIYGSEMARTWRTLMQSIVSPVISTSLYFIVVGAAIGGAFPRSAGSATAPSSCLGWSCCRCGRRASRTRPSGSFSPEWARSHRFGSQFRHAHAPRARQAASRQQRCKNLPQDHKLELSRNVDPSDCPSGKPSGQLRTYACTCRVSSPQRPS
jgi:hypothetical protein